MSIPFFIFSFVNIWCLMLFFVLAVSVKKEINPQPLDYVGAPQTFPWKQKLRLNTWISLAVTTVIAIMIELNVIPLRTMVDGL
jgi:predicted secreted protein